MCHNIKEQKEYMENNINIATEILRQKLIQDINGSGLPISTLYLIINELQWKTEKAYYAELNSPCNTIEEGEETTANETKIEEESK